MKIFKIIELALSFWTNRNSFRRIFCYLGFYFLPVAIQSQLQQIKYNQNILNPKSGAGLEFPTNLLSYRVNNTRSDYTSSFAYKLQDNQLIMLKSAFSILGYNFSSPFKLYENMYTDFINVEARWQLNNQVVSLKKISNMTYQETYAATAPLKRRFKLFKPKFNSVYILSAIDTLQLASTLNKYQILSKYDQNYKLIWSLNLPYKHYFQWDTDILEFSDSSLFHIGLMKNGNFSIHRYSKQGIILRSRIIENPAFGRYCLPIMRGNFVYLFTYNHIKFRILKLDSQLNVLKSVEFDSSLNGYQVGEFVNQDKYSHSPYHIALDAIDDTALIVDTGLNFIIKIRHPYFGIREMNGYPFNEELTYTKPLRYPRGRYSTIFSSRFFRHNPNGSFDFLTYNNVADSAYPPGIRHIHLDPSTKKETKNTFYALPYFYPGIDNDSITRVTVACFTDSNAFLISNMVTNLQRDSAKKVGLYYVKNFDFGDLPAYPSACMDSFFMDTVYSTAYTQGMRDTTYTVEDYPDTFLFKDTVPANYNTPIAADYQSLGKMVAKYALGKDSNCFSPINLVSDTGLRAGESIWHIHYVDSNHTDTFNVVNLYGYLATYNGKIRITHIHKFNNCIDIYRDSIYKLGGKPLSPKLDTAVCLPMSYTIGLPQHPRYSYLWSTGETTHSKTFTDTGVFTAIVTNLCGSYTDTMRLREKLKLNNPLKLDTLTRCLGGLPYSLASDTLSVSFRYLWSTGDTTSTTQVSSFGLYWLQVSNPCLAKRDTIYVLKKAGNEVAPPTHPDSLSLRHHV